MHAGFLRAFARDNSGASSSEYALLLFVAGTGLTLSTFMLGKAVGDSLTHSASLFASWQEPAETATASASMASGTPGLGPEAVTGSPEAVPIVDPDCKGKGKGKGVCNGQGRGEGNK